MSAHNIVLDTAGTAGRPRYTCTGPECDGATLVRQPYMTVRVWDHLASQFLLDHANARVASELLQEDH